MSVKIRVQKSGGTIELLEIAEPVSVKHGIYQDAILSADGFEYFFTKDGYYDGWGRAGDPQARRQA